MAELNEFTSTNEGGGEFNLSEASGYNPSKPSSIPLSARENSVAHTALQSDDPVGMYDTIMGEWYSFGDESPTQRRLREQREGEYREIEKQAYMQLLTDKEVDPKIKEHLVEGFKESLGIDIPPIEETLLQESVAEDKPNETPGAKSQKSFITDQIDSVHQDRQLRQAIMNVAAREVEKNDTIDTVVEMGKYFLPLMSIFNKKPTSELYALAKDDFTISGYVFEGEAIASIREGIKKMSLSERREFYTNVIRSLNGHLSGTVVGESKIKQLEILEKSLSEEYTMSERAMDDLFGILDATGTSGALIWLVRAIKGARYASKMSRAADVAFRNAVEDAKLSKITGTEPPPMSVAETFKYDQDRVAELYHRAMADESGELARIAFGMSKEELLASKTMPTITKAGEELVTSPTVDLETLLRKVADRISDATGMSFTDAELGKLMGVVERHLTGFEGFTYNPSMSNLAYKGAESGSLSDTIVARAVYGGYDGAPMIAPAVSRKKLANALAHLGVDEKDIEIIYLGKDGKYRPRKTTDAQGNIVDAAIREGDETPFLLRVNFEYKAVPTDIIEQSLDPRRNWLDRIPFISGSKATRYMGSITNNLFNSLSIFPKDITKGALWGVNQGNEVTQLMQRALALTIKRFNKLDSKEELFLTEYIKKSNYNRLPYDYAYLRAQGVSENGIQALRTFRSAADMMWSISNKSAVKNLRAEGYWKYTVGNTELFLKSFKRDFFKGDDGVRVFDPVQDKVVTLSKKEVDELYAKGGSISRGRDPLTINEDVVIGGEKGVYVKVDTEAAGVSYRALKDSDRALNYIEGYFNVSYNSRHFIIKRLANGEEVAIGTAGDIKEAKAYRDSLNKTAKEGEEYFYRGDLTREERESIARSMDGTQGNMAQRHRGKQLSYAGAAKNAEWNNPYVTHPIDAMMSSVQSASERLMIRDWMETMKSRFIKEYGKFLERDKFGNYIWPEHAGMLGKGHPQGSKEIANARTTYNYIKGIEDGYLDFVDEGWKAFANALADFAGEGSAVAERFLAKAGDITPNTQMRKAGAISYLFLNPHRQWIIQGHQSIQLNARYGPKIGQLALSDMLQLSLAKSGLIKLKPGTLIHEIAEGFGKSGMAASISKTNFIRNTQLVQTNLWLQRVNKGEEGLVAKGVGSGRKAWDTTVQLLRNVGFDAGEYMNRSTAYAAAYRAKWEKVGRRALTAREQAEVSAEAEAFIYAMTKADDFPYNATALSTIFQFMQVPHKAALQMTFDRTLTAAQRARMALWNTVMYGLPGSTLLYSLSDDARNYLVDHPELADALMFGLEEAALNTAISVMTGTDTNIHFTNLSPVDIKAFRELANTLTTKTFLDAIKNSPGGSLFAGTSPRVATAFETFADYVYPDFNIMVDTDFQPVMQRFLEIASGYSNYTKAKIAWKYQQLVSLGEHTAIGYNVTKPEAIAIAFGFTTQDAMLRMMANEKIFADSEQFRKEVTDTYHQAKRLLAAQGGDPRELAMKMNNLMGPIVSVLIDENPEAYFKIFQGLVDQDMKRGEHSIVTLYFNRWNELTDQQRKEAMALLPKPEQDNINEIFNELEMIRKRQAKKAQEARERRNNGK